MIPLLAKSPRQGYPGKTLTAHTQDVMDSVGCLFGTRESPSRLGQSWQRFFGLADCRLFHDCSLAAGAFHDWGKANEGFQRVLVNEGQQLIRHEHLSGLLLGLDAVCRWLADRPDFDQDVILSAVISHHLKVTHGTFAQKLCDGALLRLLCGDEDFQQMLTRSVTRLGLNPSKFPGFNCTWSFEERARCLNLVPHRKKVLDRLWRFNRALEDDLPRRRLLWAVRAALIAADAVGSAVVRLDQTLAEWIAEAFDEKKLCSGQTVWEKVIAPRVQELERAGRWDVTKGVGGWSRFQEDCTSLPDRALLLAPCGSGKTLAAWRWIAARLAGRRVARVIFLYPTRATATEGFRDYVSWAPEADAALVHGTAEYDLQGMFENPADPSIRDPRQGKAFEVEQRLFALGLWPRRIFSATVDQFFAFLQYQYGPVCLLPLLADAVLVIDEVHSFDRGMFSALKQFLQSFDVPVLCMTATLPDTRRQELERECRLQVYSERPEDLRRVADLPRYRVTRVGATDVVPRIQAALQAGKRVLWVVNQVGRAQQAVQQLASDFPAAELHVGPGVPLYCYHSRFKLKDRRDRHRQVVAAFQPPTLPVTDPTDPGDRHRQVVAGFQGTPGPVLAITTQVCEMSLDLDADLLVTEEAPVTALIQRMGRCNRQTLPPPRRIGEVLIYAPENTRPYDKEQLEGVAAFVDHLASRDAVSQTDLEKALEQYGPRVTEPDKACQFLESGAYAMGGEETFRDIEEFAVPAVLDADVEEFLSLRKEGKSTDGLVVPVPRKFGKQSHRGLPSYLAVAPRMQYHPAIGFCEQLLS